MIAALFAGRARRAIISYHGFFASENRLLSRLGNHGSWLFTRLCGRAIAVSDGLRNTLVEKHSASPKRTIRIYNPVFSPADIAPVTAEELAARRRISFSWGACIRTRIWARSFRPLRR